ncbi:MAG: M18 family aminopeptidase, partial [Parachlamydiaceae bacterium]|nr:M18 family aminopeptidase [Parachlamydiaceae bacterium]
MKDRNKIDKLATFLNDSPTAWHAVDNLKKILTTKGYQEIKESDRWRLKKGGRYFVCRNGSSLCAFAVPDRKPLRATIIGSHTDSPALKLKPNPEYRKEN